MDQVQPDVFTLAVLSEWVVEAAVDAIVERDGASGARVMMGPWGFKIRIWVVEKLLD